jgi:hypothetical protein
LVYIDINIPFANMYAYKYIQQNITFPIRSFKDFHNTMRPEIWISPKYGKWKSKEHVTIKITCSNKQKFFPKKSIKTPYYTINTAHIFHFEKRKHCKLENKK